MRQVLASLMWISVAAALAPACAQTAPAQGGARPERQSASPEQARKRQPASRPAQQAAPPSGIVLDTRPLDIGNIGSNPAYAAPRARTGNDTGPQPGLRPISRVTIDSQTTLGLETRRSRGDRFHDGTPVPGIESYQRRDTPSFIGLSLHTNLH
jgi:hypothetical protein